MKLAEIRSSRVTIARVFRTTTLEEGGGKVYSGKKFQGKVG